MNIGTLSIELSALVSLLDQHDFKMYWQSGLELLCRYTGAQGARMRLLDSQTYIMDNVLYAGKMDTTCQQVIGEWEEALLTVDDQAALDQSDMNQTEHPSTIDYNFCFPLDQLKVPKLLTTTLHGSYSFCTFI